jgi:ferrous iron transport protein A
MTVITLDKLVPGETGRIKKVGGRGALKRRLVDMGLISGVLIEVVRISPLGDPVEYRLRGYHLSLRKSEAETIQVELTSTAVHLREEKPILGSPLPLVMCRSGQKAVISRTRGGKKLSRKLSDLGLVPGAVVRVINSDLPGPLIISVNEECRLVLGRGMALHIMVMPS